MVVVIPQWSSQNVGMSKGAAIGLAVLTDSYSDNKTLLMLVCVKLVTMTYRSSLSRIGSVGRRWEVHVDRCQFVTKRRKIVYGRTGGVLRSGRSVCYDRW